MAHDGVCNALQGHIDALQETVEETRAGEHDVESMWREVDRICQEMAYLSEGIASQGDDEDGGDGDLSEDEDDEELSFGDDMLGEDEDEFGEEEDA